jgi:uncharacterized protein (DUF362 family)/Pyruvate/2-oxoacid:ferredoxin oxidoreductase delta subunit
MQPPMAKVIKRGDRVLLKPFLHHGRHSYPDSRLVSHPALIQVVTEALRDCGAQVMLGDEGSRSFASRPVAAGGEWMHDLARRHDIALVSFAKTGGRHVRSGLIFPRRYLLARAVLDVDHVVNCANFQPHYVLGMSGAVKNMFNAVIGAGQSRLQQIFPQPMDLAKVIVDVCDVVRPSLSFLDLTSVRSSREVDEAHPVGLLLAGAEPSALDAVAVRAMGWDATRIPTLRAAEWRHPGFTDLSNLGVVGLVDQLPDRQCVDQVPVVHPAAEKIYHRVTRLLNHTTFRPRPVISLVACTGCGDCARICPVNAIRIQGDSPPTIAHADCADCHLCLEACPTGAINTQFVGVSWALRRLTGKSLITK